MAGQQRFVAVPDSEHVVVPGAQVVGDPDPGHRIKVTVYLRRDPGSAAALPSIEALSAQLPGDRTYPTADQIESAFSASPADVAKVEAFARANGLIVLESRPDQRSVLLSGTIDQYEKAFNVDLKRYETADDDYRGLVGPVHVPADLEGIVVGVFGLDDRRVGGQLRRQLIRPLAAAAPGTLPPNTYYPPQVAALYDYPAGTDGAGQSIGIFVFNDGGGGYRVDALRKYFVDVLGGALPKIVDVVVQGQGNNPGDGSAGQSPGDSTPEVMLDMQVAGSVAPGATLVMYFTDFTRQGWVDAINRAVADTTNNPSVISISYGNPEDDPRGAFTADMVRVINDALQKAALKGITVCVAAGDTGSGDGETDGTAHVDFPASSPWVLGCGGTSLKSSGGRITGETVWNDGQIQEGVLEATGGGVSTVFPLPDYQSGAGVPASSSAGGGRGVPDVSGLADPATGVQIVDVQGNLDARYPTGGTSLTAPLWAALIARLNQALGTRVGFLNTLLYTRFSSGVLRDITEGNNGAYRAGPGWDACTGLGSPGGQALLDALAGRTAAPVAAGTNAAGAGVNGG